MVAHAPRRAADARRRHEAHGRSQCRERARRARARRGARSAVAGHARGAEELHRSAASLAVGGRGAGVTYINDSKGTNVGATLAAVAGMSSPVVLIAGGEGKNQDFTPLDAALARQLRHAVLIGRAADEIERGTRGHLPDRAGRNARGGGARRRAPPRARRCRAALAGVRKLRHVHRLRAARHAFRAGRAGACRMSAVAALSGLRRARRRARRPVASMP